MVEENFEIWALEMSQNDYFSNFYTTELHLTPNKGFIRSNMIQLYSC